MTVGRTALLVFGKVVDDLDPGESFGQGLATALLPVVALDWDRVVRFCLGSLDRHLGLVEQPGMGARVLLTLATEAIVLQKPEVLAQPLDLLSMFEHQ